jgi:hypothetical protein
MSPSLSSLSQMGGWATGPTAFKASSQEQNRKLPFFAKFTVLDDFCSIYPQSTYPRAFPSECPGVTHFLSFRQICQHTMVFPKYPRYLRVIFSSE